MDIMQRFLAYAGDFERTFADDDWNRLRQHFTDDAVYEVKAASFGCRLSGPAAIFVGMKKSLDNFDRRFTKRDVEVTSAPEISGDEMRVGWQVVYEKAGWPTFVLRGRSTARLADDKIAYLADSYEKSAEDDLADWRRQTGADVDPSYA